MFHRNNMSLPVNSKHSSKLKANLMSYSLPDSSPGLNNLDMPPFIERSSIRSRLKNADCNLNDQTGDSEDELLTVHFGNVAATLTSEQIVIDSEEESSDGSMFLCSVCAMICTDLQALKQHEMTHSEVICGTQTATEIDQDIMFVCSVCTVVCGDLQSLKEHKKTHSEVCTRETEAEIEQDIMFVCSVCTVVCGDLQTLKQHEMIHSEEVPTTYSEVRDTSYLEENNSESNIFMCSVCTVLCEDLPSLKQHEKSHSVTRTFYSHDELYSGDLIFSQAKTARHGIVHCEDRPYKCSLCNYAGKQKENLLAHMNTHTRAKQFKCEYCDYASLKAQSLRIHQALHTDKYPHKCTLCLYSTVSVSCLTSHYRNHHHKHTEQAMVKQLAFSKFRGSKYSQVRNSGRRDQVMIHNCQYCDYSSKKAYSLKLHMQAHTDEFPNKCHLCLYSTANPGNLTSHYKNHHLNNAEGQNTCAEELEPLEDNSEGYFEDVSSEFEGQDKPYKCQYCEYSASKPHRVRDHMLYHTDNFPNKCLLCVYSTNRSSNLLYHYKHHHQNKGESTASYAESKLSEPVLEKPEQEPNWINNLPVPERMYKCDQCEYTATKPHRIKEHSISHNYKYQNKCCWCVYSTANLANLNTHYRNHHRSITNMKNGFEHTETNKHNIINFSKLKNLTIRLERIPEFANYFVCDVCQKIFMKKSVFAKHMKTHLELFQYKCDICECSFRELELLETHKKSHEKEELKRPTNSSEINNGLLCKIKLTPLKDYPMRSVLNKSRIMRSKLQLQKRKSLRTSSLHITADKLQRRCKLVLHKLDKSNSLKKEIQFQSGIVSVDQSEGCSNVSESSKDQQALKVPAKDVSHGYGHRLKDCVVQLVSTGIANVDKSEGCSYVSESSKDQEALKVPAKDVPQGHGHRLKDCVVQLVSTRSETLSKIQLHRCLVCEFASTSSDSLKIHTDSQHKEDVRLKSLGESNKKTERNLKSQKKYSHRADLSLTLDNEPHKKVRSLAFPTEPKSSRKKANIKSNNTSCQNEEQNDQQALLHQHRTVHDKEKNHTLHHCLRENVEEVASSGNKTVLYKCVLCSRRSLDVESMMKHMLTCKSKKGFW